MPRPHAALAVLTPALALCLVAPVAASAAGSSSRPVIRPIGQVAAAQDTFDHRLYVHGWAFDAAHSSKSIVVRIYGSGHYLGQVKANRPSYATNRARHISGRHSFTFAVTRYSKIKNVTIRSSGAISKFKPRTLDVARARYFQPAAGRRIVTLAARFVGKARYVYDGASPKTGFDCSGFTQYIFRMAKVAKLPHSAEAQRHVKHMRLVSAKKAVAGDLVFYFDGGAAYHVAIYDGHHRQISAATPRQGIVHEPIWSHHVEYRHYG